MEKSLNNLLSTEEEVKSEVSKRLNIILKDFNVTSSETTEISSQDLKKFLLELAVLENLTIRLKELTSEFIKYDNN